MANNRVGLPIGMPEDWMPMPPDMGPPLPRFFGILWPWYKPAPPEGYICPYCGAPFSTFDDMVQHIQTAHPTERIPLPIEWE